METLSFRARLAYVLTAFLSIALMGGAVYGWPSMREVLLRDRVLYDAEECDGNALGEVCDSQELAFGVVFTVGAWANQGGRLLVGIALDRLGTRYTSAGCVGMCGLGAAVFGLTSSKVGLSVGMFLIGAGGAGVQLALQSTSALFPLNRSLVMASLSGAFQLASSVFLIMETVHRLAHVSRRWLFVGYAGVLLLVSGLCLLIWPTLPFGVIRRPSNQPTEVRCGEHNRKALPLTERSFREQLFSPDYLVMATYFTLAVLQAQFNIQSLGVQFQLMGHDSADLVRIFNIVFSLTWTITPLVGHSIDRLGSVRVLIVMNTLLLCCPVCLLSQLYFMQIVFVISYSISRVSIWAVFFSYMGLTFGFSNYGKLAGGGLFFAACVSLLQIPLYDSALVHFDNDFTFVNCLFVAICVFIMYPLIGVLDVLQRKSRDAAVDPAGPAPPTSEPSSHEDGGGTAGGHDQRDSDSRQQGATDSSVTQNGLKSSPEIACVPGFCRERSAIPEAAGLRWKLPCLQSWPAFSAFPPRRAAALQK